MSEELAAQAKRYVQIQHRSVPKQIEYWSQIDRIPRKILICRLA
ncbi:TA system antitoxin ParD family protein [Nitrosomonas communis]